MCIFKNNTGREEREEGERGNRGNVGEESESDTIHFGCSLIFYIEMLRPSVFRDLNLTLILKLCMSNHSQLDADPNGRNNMIEPVTQPVAATKIISCQDFTRSRFDQIRCNVIIKHLTPLNIYTKFMLSPSKHYRTSD